jgi:hypothetical protein
MTAKARRISEGILAALRRSRLVAEDWHSSPSGSPLVRLHDIEVRHLAVYERLLEVACPRWSGSASTC